ncbi:MAG: hypothetical protein SGI92_05375 [Bryobacteraceae bacterium]|nr:hypothetical protein [Bryobacteraceae bacterium]
MTRTEAAHTNGALSKGPITTAGKAVSSRNAIKHGLTAAEIVAPGEDPRAFDILRKNIEIDTGAKTVRELDLVFEMAAARWRLRRLAIIEKALIDREMDRMNQSLADPANQRTPEALHADAWLAVAESQTMKQIHRHETRLHRHYEKSSLELQAITEFRLSIEASGERVHPCTLEVIEQDAANEAAAIEAEPAAEPETTAVQNEPDTSRPRPAARAA